MTALLLGAESLEQFNPMRSFLDYLVGNREQTWRYRAAELIWQKRKL
jgi:hypothetical protein